MQPIFKYYREQYPSPDASALWLYGEPYKNDAAYSPLARPSASIATDTVFSTPQQITGMFETIYLAAPRHHEETEGLVALALRHATGRVVTAAHNEAGGRRLRGILEAYAVPVSHLSKHHAQLVWTEKPSAANAKRIDSMLMQLSPRKTLMGNESYWTVPGLFSWDRIDTGSRLLAETLPQDLHGAVADFGCGYGYLTAQLERSYTAIQHIDAFDADARAVECAARNTGTKSACRWQDIRALSETRRYDAVIMNPPFHTGKDEHINLGKQFIEKAWACLKPGGRLFLVANRHLPYEKIVPGMQNIVDKDGYKILTARRA